MESPSQSAVFGVPFTRRSDVLSNDASAAKSSQFWGSFGAPRASTGCMGQNTILFEHMFSIKFRNLKLLLSFCFNICDQGIAPPCPRHRFNVMPTMSEAMLSKGRLISVLMLGPVEITLAPITQCPPASAPNHFISDPPNTLKRMIMHVGHCDELIALFR